MWFEQWPSPLAVLGRKCRGDHFSRAPRSRGFEPSSSGASERRNEGGRLTGRIATRPCGTATVRLPCTHKRSAVHAHPSTQSVVRAIAHQGRQMVTPICTD